VRKGEERGKEEEVRKEGRGDERTEERR